MTKGYVITAATAFALGAGTMSVAQLGEAQGAIAVEKSTMVETAIGTPASNTLENFVTTRHCANVDAELGLSGAQACSAAILREVHFDKSGPGGGWVMRSQWAKAGSWVPGAPQ